MNDLDKNIIQYRLLKLLSQKGNLTQREMAKKMGVSLGKLNYCVSELTRKGMVKVIRSPNALNLRSYAYLLTPEGIKEKMKMARRFLSIRIKEYDEIKKQIRELSMELEIDDPEEMSADGWPDELEAIS
ncbi:MAG: MarR family EPS-associated transcriptional regulator [Desulfobacterales bacterium]